MCFLCSVLFFWLIMSLIIRPFPHKTVGKKKKKKTFSFLSKWTEFSFKVLWVLIKFKFDYVNFPSFFLFPMNHSCNVCVFFHRGFQWCSEFCLQNSPETTRNTKSVPVLVDEEDLILWQGEKSVNILCCCHHELLCYLALSFSTWETQSAL